MSLLRTMKFQNGTKVQRLFMGEKTVSYANNNTKRISHTIFLYLLYLTYALKSNDNAYCNACCTKTWRNPPTHTHMPIQRQHTSDTKREAHTDTHTHPFIAAAFHVLYAFFYS